ncbi:MAG: hypothetical protein HQK57_17285, partial [Deltaproteobacteria bacterium]|nr:hypothetical protein [Deltaproteobacteria bacterium]
MNLGVFVNPPKRGAGGGTGNGTGMGSINYGTNIGTNGVGTFDSVSGETLRFRNLKPATDKLDITLDTADHTINFDLNEANLGLNSRVTSLEETYVRAHWYTQISAGTTGIITASAATSIPGAAFVMDQWANGVDAALSTVVNGFPTSESPVTAAGAAVATTFDVAGNYAFNGTPGAYPVALIFVYRCRLKNFDDSKSLFEHEVETHLAHAIPAISAEASALAHEVALWGNAIEHNVRAMFSGGETVTLKDPGDINLFDLKSRSHTGLSSIGTNTHDQIDSAITSIKFDLSAHVTAANPHTGAASAAVTLSAHLTGQTLSHPQIDSAITSLSGTITTHTLNQTNSHPQIDSALATLSGQITASNSSITTANGVISAHVTAANPHTGAASAAVTLSAHLTGQTLSHPQIDSAIATLSGPMTTDTGMLSAHITAAAPPPATLSSKTADT